MILLWQVSGSLGGLHTAAHRDSNDLPSKRKRAKFLNSDSESPLPQIVTDPIETAESAGLRYTPDSRAGISRVPAKDGFRYLNSTNSEITDPDVLKRIRALAIPPAWTEVWICPYPNGHLQATGRDARGRKQYRYHPKWRSVRDENKFEKMLLFGHALPMIRQRVREDLAGRKLTREKVLATVVRLLETTLIRIGNEEYAKQNDSFGLTTMRDRHARIEGSEIEFRFKGKSSKKHSIKVRDRRLANIVKKCQDIPGDELFQYVDEEGVIRSIDSGDVNSYLKEITGEDFTAKDFRTWAGTVMAALALQQFKTFDTKAQAKKNVVAAIEVVARMLGNTPAICKKCYIHPVVLDLYLDGGTVEGLRARTEEKLTSDLSELRPEEAAVLVVLRERLANPVIGISGEGK